MKNSSFYFSVEYNEDGYNVTKRKYYSPKFDKAIMVNLLDEFALWSGKKKDEWLLEIIGNGLENSFCQRSICRVIKRCMYDHNNPFEYRIIWFYDSSTDNPVEIYSSKKEAMARFKEMFLRLFPERMTVE